LVDILSVYYFLFFYYFSKTSFTKPQDLVTDILRTKRRKIFLIIKKNREKRGEKLRKNLKTKFNRF